MREPTRRAERILALLVLLLAVAVVNQAAGSVMQKTTLTSIYVERLELPGSFFVAETITERALATLYAQGTAERPVAMSEGASAPLVGTLSTAIANTAIFADHWTYTVVLQETDVDVAPLGNYSVTLDVGGDEIGTVHLVKTRHVNAIANPLTGGALVPAVDAPLAPVGARVTFDLGIERPTSPVFILKAVYVDIPTYHIKSTQDLNSGMFYWVGVGGDIDGITNPTLLARVGEAFRILATQGDGQAPHDLAIWNEDNETVAGPTPRIVSLGDEQALVWAPEAAGNYTYVCTLHLPTQVGPILVRS